MAPSSVETEFHKSFQKVKNVQFTLSDNPLPCSLCERVFRSNVNLLLHVYWHAYNKDPTGTASTSSTPPDEDEDESDDSTGQNEPICHFNFVASHGWINIFNNRYDIKNLKQKGEIGVQIILLLVPGYRNGYVL